MESVLVDDEHLTITFSPGETDTAIVSFSGVGLEIGKIPQQEFVKTLRGARHHQYFVVDKKRTWYNATAAAIQECLAEPLRSHRSVVTLGNSMGGFGAIYFASRFPNCDSAIAFVPQFSVDSAIMPEEKRWMVYRSQINEWTIHHAMEGAKEDVPLHLFFAKPERRDGAHKRLFRRHGTAGMAIYTLEEAKRHDAAPYLREHGILSEVLNTIVVENATSEGVRCLLTDHNIPHSVWKQGA